MNPKLKKILSALFILLSIFAVVIIAFSNPEMGNAWEAISRLSSVCASSIATTSGVGFGPFPAVFSSVRFSQAARTFRVRIFAASR